MTTPEYVKVRISPRNFRYVKVRIYGELFAGQPCVKGWACNRDGDTKDEWVIAPIDSITSTFILSRKYDTLEEVRS